MEKKHCLRLVTMNSDESTVPAATRTVSLLDPDTGRPLTGVTAVVAMISTETYREIEMRHREPDRSSGKVEWKVDMKSTTEELLTLAVQRWDGVIGADNKPIPVNGKVLQHLDFLNAAHLAGIARTPAEALDAEVVAASFRQPPVVD